MNFDYVFIITYGRSGSTLLQGILNTIPGADIRGENGNLLFHIYQMSKGLAAGKRHKKAARDATHPWYGANDIPQDAYLEEMLTIFKRDIMPSRQEHVMTGFKEIRFQVPYQQLVGYMDFVMEVFPRSAFVFNTRDLDAVIESNRLAKHNVSEDRIRDADVNFRRIFTERSKNSYLIHYDDYVRDPAVLKGLFDFLGAPFDAKSVERTLEQTHSVRTRKDSTSKESTSQ
ncbi:sulfotransferase [Aliiroseovarius sediminis]|uniref:sulfotransferase n=1 Tax=Aliiroseovarius sediminis TaxID=2925839 RepID=UPI001F5A94F8|nr:sulfotransferase [Aliiroseovarius sediminis]MCI2395571.1 sulfotransferase [Aliiroseovarius sediminis]